MSTIADRLSEVRHRIAEAEARYGRAAGGVRLLAVSKTLPAQALREAADAGQRAFGESYLQEALAKQQDLADLDLEWHFIGPIQSNKTRGIAAHFAWVHSVERLKVARRLSEQRPAGLPPLNVCLEVNVSGEASKSGVGLEALPELAERVANLPRLALRGLMAVPARSDTLVAQREPFRRLRSAFEGLRARGLPLDTLSMGMTADMEAAIAEGATLVRIGTAIFGPRACALPASPSSV
jgi:pyridoxal phosphate enzyme (YggS family)